MRSISLKNNCKNNDYKRRLRNALFEGLTIIVYCFDFRVAVNVAAGIISPLLVTDFMFSVIVTSIFLKPLLEVLTDMESRDVDTAAHGKLKRTLALNLAGVVIAVTSRTVLFLNGLAWFATVASGNYVLSRSFWGNIFSFGIHLGSILNNVGMLLLCGLFIKSDVPKFFKG